MREMEHSEPFIQTYPFAGFALIISFNIFFSWACSRLAETRGKAKGKWAKYGFFFTIWAFIWLYFIEEPEN